jgi:hypothetical protein
MNWLYFPESKPVGKKQIIKIEAVIKCPLCGTKLKSDVDYEGYIFYFCPTGDYSLETYTKR